VGNHVIFSNNGTIAGHVQVGDHVILGGLSAVHQFCRIGAHSMTGGCSKIVQDVPPFMIADGNPAKIRGLNKVGLDRHGISPEAQKALKEAYRILFRSDWGLHEALQTINDSLPDLPEILRLKEFLQSSSRGILR
jgi:UDP-N-acetylglucosamine acyltransferase